ncbi:MAG: hypothetical protein ABIQ73_21850 [Acidimicrobiales bacterium]
MMASGRVLATLGVQDYRLLGFEDGTCHTADGMTGHLDHCAVSRWITDAWRATGSDAHLWYRTVTPDFHQRWTDINERVGFWYDHANPPNRRTVAGSRRDRVLVDAIAR